MSKMDNLMVQEKYFTKITLNTNELTEQVNKQRQTPENKNDPANPENPVVKPENDSPDHADQEKGENSTENKVVKPENKLTDQFNQDKGERKKKRRRKKKSKNDNLEKPENISIMSITQTINALTGELLRREVEATITPKHINNSTSGSLLNNKECKLIMGLAGYEEKNGDDRSHIVARELGGTNHPLNLIPMSKLMNRPGGPYRQLEGEIKNDIKNNKYTYKLTYIQEFEDKRLKPMIIRSEVFNDSNKLVEIKAYLVDFDHIDVWKMEKVNSNESLQASIHITHTNDYPARRRKITEELKKAFAEEREE